VSRYKTMKIITRLNLQAKQRVAYKVTTKRKHSDAVAANLLNQNFNPIGQNQIWAGDITYYVPGVQGKHERINEPRVYLKYVNKLIGVKTFAPMPGCAGIRV